MKILFLSTWFPYPPDNGSKLRVYHLLAALAQAHQVTLVSFAFDTARPEDASNLHALCSDAQVIPLNPFAINQAGPLRTFLSASPVVSRPIPAMSRAIASLSSKYTYDAVIASTEMMASHALRLRPSVAKILEEHNSLTRWMHERYTEQRTTLNRLRCWASWRKTRRYETRLFRQFDLVTMVSEQDRAVCLAEMADDRKRVRVVPNGVDCQHNRPGLAQPRPDSLVYNGSLTYSANYDAMRWFLAEIYPRIKAQAPGVTLTITGSTQGVNTAGLALDGTVRLTGFVEDVRLPVAEAAVCIAPIRQGGGTRLKILEAMALGTPVVATTKGAEGLEVVNKEHVLLADNPAEFAAAVSQLLLSDDLRAQQSKTARRLVEQHYDWKNIGRRFVELIEAAAISTRGRTS